MKRFNVTGTCYPYKHYMVDISERLKIIAQMVERGDYFCINAGRQYGKTTTLNAAECVLSKDYLVLPISFEGMSPSQFESIESLDYAFLEEIQTGIDCGIIDDVPESIANLLRLTLDEAKNNRMIRTNVLNALITKVCALSPQKVVLIIDEVDQASNYPAFIEFLGILRKKYLVREKALTFQSVILAGVYDIKNLKLKIRQESDHQYNSPWNIATQFDVDMSLPADGIEGMIAEYKSDHAGIPEIDCMDAHQMAQLIFDYTSGYPFLVSRICQILDEKKLQWNYKGFLEALRILLHERNTLFDDLAKKLYDFTELRNMFRDILINGRKYAFNILEKHIQLAALFNFIKDSNKTVAISNRIFETILYDLFLAEDEIGDLSNEGSIDKNQFIKDGQIDMDHLLSRFATHFNDIYGKNDDAFVEKTGRKLFLLYLKPIINGIGNYYIEAQTRDETRTDVIIDYLGHQYIIELKIWRGNAYNERGEAQIAGYLDYFHAKKGYLVSFCFNKNKNPGTKTIQVSDKTVVECVV